MDVQDSPVSDSMCVRFAHSKVKHATGCMPIPLLNYAFAPQPQIDFCRVMFHSFATILEGIRIRCCYIPNNI